MTTFTRLFSRALAAVSLLFSVGGIYLDTEEVRDSSSLRPTTSNFGGSYCPSNPNQDAIGPRFKRPPPSISRGNAGAIFGRGTSNVTREGRTEAATGSFLQSLEDY